MMSRSIKRHAVPLYVIAKNAILEMIRDTDYAENKLPSEADLSERLGISRTTIREALITLQREGVITKQHGLGNRIHRSTLDTRMQIDRYSDFRALIEDGGYTAGVERTEPIWIEDLSSYDIEDPEKGEDEHYIYLASVYTADGNKAILSKNFIKSDIAGKETEGSENLKDSSFIDLLNRFSREEVANTIISFKPVVADENLASKFEVPRGSALMQWRETSYSVMDRVICLGLIVFNPNLINLTLLRKWK